MTRKQRIEALEYLQSYYVIVIDYHYTQKPCEMNFRIGNLSRSQAYYLFNQRLISKLDFKKSVNVTRFTINEKGEQRLKQLKDKHEYFNQKKK